MPRMLAEAEALWVIPAKTPGNNPVRVTLYFFHPSFRPPDWAPFEGRNDGAEEGYILEHTAAESDGTSREDGQRVTGHRLFNVGTQDSENLAIRATLNCTLPRKTPPLSRFLTAAGPDLPGFGGDASDHATMAAHSGNPRLLKPPDGVGGGLNAS